MVQDRAIVTMTD